MELLFLFVKSSENICISRRNVVYLQAKLKIMYYSHLKHRKRLFSNNPDIHDIRYRQSDSSEMMLTAWCFVFLITILIAGFISYETTKEVSPDASHVHWKLFGKEMISEDGHIRSHHYMHPEKCAICKKIQKEQSK